MFGPPIYDGLNINLHFHSTSLFCPPDVNPYFPVEFLLLLFKTHIGVFSVYGEPKSASTILVGFELQNNDCPALSIIRVIQSVIRLFRIRAERYTFA